MTISEQPEQGDTPGTTRVTFNATPRAMAALQALMAASGDNRTDVINTQLRRGELLQTLAHPDGGLRVVGPDGSVHIIHLV